MRVLFGFYASIVAFLVLNMGWVYSHASFVRHAEIIMTPQTAVGLGLMSESFAPRSGGLVFQKNKLGGFDYRDAKAFAYARSTDSTNLDIPAECERIGGCEVAPRKP